MDAIEERRYVRDVSRTSGEKRLSQLENISFTIIKVISRYNAMTSSFHQCMKFPTEAKIYIGKDFQQRVRECYFIFTRDILDDIDDHT